MRARVRVFVVHTLIVQSSEHVAMMCSWKGLKSKSNAAPCVCVCCARVRACLSIRAVQIHAVKGFHNHIGQVRGSCVCPTPSTFGVSMMRGSYRGGRQTAERAFEPHDLRLGSRLGFGFGLGLGPGFKYRPGNQLVHTFAALTVNH